MNSYPSTGSPYHAELLRLVRGQATALHFKARNKVILLTPGVLYGFEESTLVVSGIGESCGIVDLRQINVTPFIKAGLSAHAATVLKSELERTYRHATQTIIDHQTTGNDGPKTGSRKARAESPKAKQPSNRRGRKGSNRQRVEKDSAKGRAAKGSK